MRNKVDVRAFCVEQVVKASGVSDAKKVVEEAKVLEEYITGGANLPEMDNELSEMKKFFQDTMERLEENRKENSIRGYREPFKVKSFPSCSNRRVFSVPKISMPGNNFKGILHSFSA